MGLKFSFALAGGLGCLLSAVLCARDINNDGLSDVWQNRYGIPGSAALADPDGDGALNWAEAAAGTDPFNATQYLRATVSYQGGQPHLLVPSQPGKLYQCFSSSDLQSWWPAGQPVSGTGQTVDLPLPAASRAFYRVAIAGETDADADGLSLWEEQQLGTLDNDGDNNGLPDWWERFYFAETGVDPQADTDGDTVPNLTEYLNGTDPAPAAPVIRLELPAQARLLP